ncbi:MAG TPA: DUF167 domain-containing protein [Termitinemataceae bacterium]|nr:DUF167 domain-containing protein [Termitinemataceae bacterium]
MSIFYEIQGDKLLIHCKINAGASHTQIMKHEQGRLYIRVAAAPEDGKANRELLSFLAKTFHCPKRDISLIQGERSHLKTLALPLSCLEICRKIEKNTSPPPPPAHAADT